jgi:hypothetical protein
MKATIQFVFTENSTYKFNEKNIIKALEYLKKEYQYDISNYDNKKISLL